MELNIGFGAVRGGSSPLKSAAKKFRIAVLGDFTCRSSRGAVETGEALARRKTVRVDVDNLDDVLARWKPTIQLPLGGEGATIELTISSMDDLHPDQLYDNVELFSELAGLRQRLKNSKTFAAAAKEMQAWSSEVGEEEAVRMPRRSEGNAIPVARMDDFRRLVGRDAKAAGAETAIDDLLHRIVGSHVIPAKDPKQDKMLASVDAALSDTMRSILHHPDFQAVESLWRSVDMLVRRIETDENMEIVLVDVTAAELAADLASAESLEDTGLYKLLVEQPSLDARQGPFALIVGSYLFERVPPHVELLGRLAKIAVLAKAPLVASVTNEVIKKVKPEDVNPLVSESWNALRAMPEAAYLGLTVPRFLLRWPYGKKTEPISPFAFEEFTRSTGVGGMLWGNGAVLVALTLAETYAKQGMNGMKLGSVASIGDMPYYVYTDEDGDSIALPCTDRLLSETLCQHVTSQGLMPLLSFKNRPEVRVGSFQSLAGKTLLGPWSNETVTVTPGQGAAPAAPVPAAAPAPAAPAAPAEAAPAAASADAELDALLASLGGDSSPPAAPPADAGGSADAELDALLASLGGGDAPAPEAAPAAGGDDGGMDPDLAALLADL